MKTRVLGLALLLAGSIPVGAQTVAPPNALNFQGRLANSSGNPLPDGSYNLRFRIYDAATGGTTLYDQSITNVPVKNGTFAIKIDGFTADKFNGNAWLGISINGATELSPRTPIVSVPYALKSNLALTVPDGSITNAKLAGGITADKFASGVLNANTWLLGGNSGTNPATQFIGTTDGQPLLFKTNNAERMRILSNGSVGIGTNAPAANMALDVNGNIHSRGADFILDGRGSGYGWGLGRALVDAGDPITGVYGGGLFINFENDYGRTVIQSPLDVSDNLTVGGTPVGAGLTTEVGGTQPILNLDVNFRHAIKNTTYPGAALRLDMRSGQPALQFLSRDANSATENTPFRIERNGFVGIGNLTPQSMLDVAGGATFRGGAITVQSAGLAQMVINNTSGASLLLRSNTDNAVLRTTALGQRLELGTNNGTTMTLGPNGGGVGIGKTADAGFALDVVGTVRATGGFITSDARYKQNIAPLDNALDTLLNLNGVSYQWNRAAFPQMKFREGEQLGFIAQEVEKVLPALVNTDEHGYKSVNYVGVIPVLVEAVKAQQAQIQDKQQQIDALKQQSAEIADLKLQLAALRDLLEKQAQIRR